MAAVGDALIYSLFTLAVYALPFFVAVTVGTYVYDTDAGLFAAFASAFFAGAVTLVLGQIAFATIRSVSIRIALGAIYALPAGIAGFHAIKGLSGIGGAGETWTLVSAGIGAIVVGAMAWARVVALAGPVQDGSVRLLLSSPCCCADDRMNSVADLLSRDGRNQHDRALGVLRRLLRQPCVAIPLFIRLLFVNGPAAGFSIDASLSIGVFGVWSFLDARGTGTRPAWVVLPADGLAGLSLTLPLNPHLRAGTRH